MKRILVAMSGGVDSSVAALLLKKNGYSVEGAYMKTWAHEENIFTNCPWEDDIKDAEAVAKKLNIPFRSIDLIEEYKEKVAHYLIEGYRSGLTPNPDIICNRDIKFGIFLQYALKEGFEGIATGHYCQKQENPDGTEDLVEGADPNKDQSYFLALISQDQLKKALFPVGHLNKAELREIAETHNFPNANKKDSQGICFLGKVSINDFLKQYIPEKPGDIVNIAGKVLGQHKGLYQYTLGQRKGIGIPSNTESKAYVVVSKNLKENQLVVEFDDPAVKNLYQSEITIQNLHYINREIKTESKLLGKPRYRDFKQALTLTPKPDQKAQIQFEKPQRALARGQVLALYDGEKVVGGGFYT